MEESLRALGPPVRKSLPWLLAGAAAVGLLLFGADRIRRRVNADGRFLVEPATLYVRKDLEIGRLEEPVSVTVWPMGMPASVSTLEGGLAARLARGFARHPWVEQVGYLKIAYPNKVRVRLTLRRPVAAVRVGNVYHWVDRQGVRLPRRSSVHELNEAGLMYIRGVRGPVPDEGQPWADPGVRAGAETALVLADDVQPLGLTVVDVSNINGRRDPYLSEIVLLNTRFTPILWGRPPSTERTGELPPGQKLSQLREAAARGCLDGPDTVDIRFPNLAIRRPPR